MTVEFKVGDKVRVVNVDGILYGEKHYFNGFETEVVYTTVDGKVILLDKNGDEGVYINKKELAKGVIELIEPKVKNKQRITALEETVATLTQQVQDLQAQIDEMVQQSKPSVEKLTYGFEKPGEVTGEIGAERTHVSQLTPNEQRKLIIEKAKQFINKCKSPFGNYRVHSIFFPKYCTCEFVVNAEKRTVVALLKGINSGDVHARGIAKCDPSDVFNEHIGKAIALGRALGLDVSEFENAVQPTELVVGQITCHGEVYAVKPTHRTHGEWAGQSFAHVDEGYTIIDTDGFEEWIPILWAKIINDTNAQY